MVLHVAYGVLAFPMDIGGATSVQTLHQRIGCAVGAFNHVYDACDGPHLVQVFLFGAFHLFVFLCYDEDKTVFLFCFLCQFCREIPSDGDG